MTSEKEYQEKIRRLGALVEEINQGQGNPAGATAREMAQLLMEVHGAGVERMMEACCERPRDFRHFLWALPERNISGLARLLR